MSRGIIYLILNKQNGHKYVGNTTLAMNKEWVQHIERSKRMSSEPLHKAFRELGVHNFMIKEIDEYDESELEKKTNYWINKYQPEYNVYTPPVQVVKEPIITAAPKPKKQTTCKPWGTLTEETRGNGKHSGLRIRGKNLQTGICTDYDSARDAALSVTGDPKKNSNILLAARNNGTAYGHKWQILEDKSKKKSVFGVNKKTGEIGARYESIADAVRSLSDAGTNTGIVKSLRNPGKYSWHGYFWFFG